MHVQLNLFAANGDSRHTQRELFEAQPVVSNVRCECGAALIETDSYLICPACLGKLIPDVPTPDEDEQ